jgi:hypothetical protein
MTDTPVDAFATASQATDQLREIADKANGASRAYGHLALDTYEKAIANLVEYEQQAAETAQVDWVRNAVGAHAKFVEDVNAAYVKAAREVLA